MIASFRPYPLTKESRVTSRRRDSSPTPHAVRRTDTDIVQLGQLAHRQLKTWTTQTSVTTASCVDHAGRSFLNPPGFSIELFRFRPDSDQVSRTSPRIPLSVDQAGERSSAPQAACGVFDRSARLPVSEAAEQAECPTESGPRAPARHDHFFCGAAAFFASGYFVRSARHFFTSSGLSVAVCSSISRSRASRMRVFSRSGIVLSRAFSPS